MGHRAKLYVLRADVSATAGPRAMLPIAASTRRLNGGHAPNTACVCCNHLGWQLSSFTL
jgi:hypothetical protein